MTFQVEGARMCPIPQNDNFIFLIGAGFSAERDLPVMTGFMERARHNYFTQRNRTDKDDDIVESYRRLLKFQQRCLGSSWAFNRNWDNIEELYTQADLLRLCKKRGAKKLCDKIAWAIWDVYRKPEPPDEKQNLRKFLGLLWSAHLKPVFITTNYDNVIEEELSLTERIAYYYPGFGPIKQHAMWFERDKDSSETKKSISLPSGIPIIKLHGSTNWFYANDKINDWFALRDITLINPRQSPPYAIKALTAILKDSVGPEKGSPLTKLTPAIIPPMLGKASVAPAIARQWSEAIESLKLARQICVIGYSFPTTDTFMKRLLSEGIQKNSNLKEIIIIDMQLPQKWEERLNDLFPPVMRGTKVKFYPVKAQSALGKIVENNSYQKMHDSLMKASFEHVRDARFNMIVEDPTIPI